MSNLFNELDKIDITSILTENEEVDLDNIQETNISETIKTADQATIETIAEEFSDEMAISGITSVNDYSVEQAIELTESIIDRLNIKGGDKLVESVLSYIGLTKKKSVKVLKEADENKEESIEDVQSRISALNKGLEGLDKTDAVSKDKKFDIDGKEYTKSSASSEIKKLEKKLEKLNASKNKDLENGFGDDTRDIVEAEDPSMYAYDLDHIIGHYEYQPDIEIEEDFRKGGDSSYFRVCRTASDAEKFNYHSDYWGSEDVYQEEAVELLSNLEEFMDEPVKVDGEVFTLKGVAIDKQYNSISHMKILVSPYEKAAESEDLNEAMVNPDVDNIDQESKNKATIEKAIKIAGNKNTIDNDKFREMKVKLSNSDYSMVDRLDDYALLRGEEVIYTWLRAEDENLKENININITGDNVNVNKDDVNVSVDPEKNVNVDINDIGSAEPVEDTFADENGEGVPVEDIPVEDGIEEAGAEVNLGAKVDIPDDLASAAGMALLASEDESSVDEEVLADPEQAKKSLDLKEDDDEGVDWNYFDQFEGIIDEYMPDQGEGETKASQIVTAINKLIYKWYNDGDVYDNTHRLQGWANDLSDYANWLAKYVDGARQILNEIENAKSDGDYEQILALLADNFLNKDVLEKYAQEEKEGSIYDCGGDFEFSEYSEDDEDDWYDYSDDEEEDEEYDESESLKEDNSVYGTKAELFKKYPDLNNVESYQSYSNDDYMAADFDDNGNFKGLRLANRGDELKEADEFKYTYSVNEIRSELEKAYAITSGYSADNADDADYQETLDEMLKNVDKIESTTPLTMISQYHSEDYPGFKGGSVKTLLKDGRTFIWTEGDEEELPLVNAVELTLSKEVTESEGFQVDNVPGKTDQGKRIELAKLENENGKTSYRVSYLNEKDEEIVGWDIDAENDEDAVAKLDAFSNADEVADDILGQDFKASGVDGVLSLFYKGANINLASDGDSFMITIDKDGEDPVILNGETSDDVMSALILWYIMNTSSTEEGLDVVDSVVKTVEDTATDLEPAADLDVDSEETSEEIKEEEGEGMTSIEVELPFDFIEENMIFDEDTGEYALAGDYADLSVTHMEEAPRETNFDDTEFFKIEGDASKISAFLDEFDLRDNI